MTERAAKSERGDTLIEVLLALVVLSLAALALIIGFSESISASARHRALASASVVLDRESQAAVSTIQQNAALFQSCMTAPNYNSAVNADAGGSLPIVSGYTEAISAVGYWNGSVFEPNTWFGGANPVCPESATGNVPEQVTMTVTDTAHSHSYSMTFVVVYPLSGSNASVNNNPATQLQFNVFPSGGSVGVPFTTQPVVAVEDQYGNAVTTDLSPIILSAFQGATPVSVTGCTESEFNGLVTFSGCTISAAGTYTLTASSPGSIPAVSSASTTITIGTASYQLVFTTQPAGGASGGPFSTPPVVKIEDSNNVVDTSWSGTVTISASGGVLTGCSNLTVTNGVVNDSSCTFAGGYYYNAINNNYLATPYTLTATATSAITTSPATSATFSVSNYGTASKLVFSTQPSGVASSTATAAFTTQPQVTVEDSFGNQVVSGYSTNISLTMSSGTLTCTSNSVAPSGGTAAFAGCHGSAYANGLTLTASSGTLTPATSTSFNITPAATKVVFTTQPVAGASGASFATEPVIQFQDAAGDVVTAVSTPISLSASGGALSYCSSLTPVNGVVTVTGCTFAGVVGTNYTLTASATGVTSAVSAPFSPTTFGTPTQLVFTTQPVAGAAGSLLTTQPVVKIEDSGGNITNSTATISLTSSTGGVLAGCANLAGIAGVVDVSNCTFGGLVGTNYTLTASASSLSSVTSANIAVTGPGPVEQIILTGCSSNFVWPGTCSATATLEDQFTNVETGDNSSSVAFSQVGGSGTVAGLTSGPATTGVRSVSLTGSTIGSVTIEAQADSVTSNTVTFTILPAPQSVAFYTNGSYTTTTTSGSAAFNGPLTYQTYAKGSQNGAISFASTTPSLCSISPSGLISVLGAGSCVVTADASAIGNYADSGTTTFTLTVSKGNQTITYTSSAPGGATVGGATYSPTATASSGLAVSFTVDASSSSICSISGGKVSFQAVGTCTLDANQAGNANWNAAPQVQQGFSVAKGSQTISFTSTAPGSATVGGSTYSPTASATSGLAVAITVDASSSSICSISGGVVSFQAVGTCTLDANQAGNVNWYAAAQVQQSFAVGKGAQTITFTSSAPGAAKVGGATYTPSATAASGLAVTITVDASSSSICSISGGVVSFQVVGTCTLDANQAGNANWNSAPQVQQSFAVGKGNQTITFTSTAPASATYNSGATYTPTATATSGLAATITVDASSSSVCSISGGVVSWQAAGTCTLDANQAGNANWNAAPQVQQGFTVAKANQTITYTSTAPGAAKVGGATYTPTATAASGLAVTITVDASSSSICSISGGVVSFQAAGTCTLDANQAGNGNWNAAAQLQQSFTVAKGNQTVSFTSTAPASATVGGATYTPTATATSGLAAAITVDAASSSICSISGGVVSYQAVGTCTLDANQAGNANWNAAAQVQQSFSVAKGNQTVSFTSTAPGSATVGGATYTPTATATSGLAVTITVDASSSSICSISGGVVSYQAVGTCKLDANQAGNANWNAAAQVQQSFSVAKGNQTISFTSTAPASATYNSGATYTPTATATSGLAVTITVDASSSGVCSISGGVVSWQAVGTCKLDANQAGNSNWNAAAQVQQSFAVAKANQTITFTSTAPASATVGGATYTPTATATSGLAVTITVDATSSSICSISGGVVSFQAAGTCKLDANQAGNGNWNAAAQVQQSFTVGKGNQTVSFTSTAPGSATVGGATYSPTATTTSGLAVTITVDATSSSICAISSGTVSFQAIGTCKLDANQAGNANWNTATQVTQSFTVGKGSQTVSFFTSAPSNATVGGATYTPTATATSGLAVTITVDATSSSVCSISGGVVSFLATGTCKLDANQAGNANWNAAPQVQQSFTVSTSGTYSGSSSGNLPNGSPGDYYGINTASSVGSTTSTANSLTPGVAEHLTGLTFTINSASGTNHVATVGIITGGVWTATALTCTIAGGSGLTSCTISGSVNVPVGSSINIEAYGNGSHTGSWSTTWTQP